MRICLRRGEFIAGLGGAATWPLAARTQQRAMPVIGYLSGRSADSDASILVSFRRGLADVGYAEGRNVAVEYRFADGRYDRIPAMAADLVGRRVGVIAATDTPAVLAVKAETATIPIVFAVGLDPVRTGLVASMNRPGGNVTGVNTLVSELSGKHLTDGRNVRIDLRWGRTDINRIRALAQELVGLQPDIIVTANTPATVALRRETLMIPIMAATHPVASGIVPRLNQPGGNITGLVGNCTGRSPGARLRCIKEAERMHPPLVMLMRKVIEDLAFDGHVVPAGDLAMVSPAVSHRIPEIFSDAGRLTPNASLHRAKRTAERHTR
jgi:hypothetical protein